MLSLSNLKASQGTKRKRKRVGRGTGSGTGKTCGKGQKGQKCRSGSGIHPWFEGGQMALQRRLPKRGFTNIFKKEYEIVNVSQLNNISQDGPITPEVMKEKGLVKNLRFIKILGNGDLRNAITIHAQKFSSAAQEKIDKSGGKAVVI
tara:strand:- start:259 stop:699 length:441 start_codon:yes stop_codon:yes gene_type:complete